MLTAAALAEDGGLRCQGLAALSLAALSVAAFADFDAGRASLETYLREDVSFHLRPLHGGQADGVRLLFGILKIS